MKIRQDEISNILFERFQEIKRTNSSYSLRSYALKLGLNSGVLSQIMNKKRDISIEFAEKLAASLALSEEERERFMGSFKVQQDLKLDKLDARVVGDDVLDRLTDWYLLAILSLVKLNDFVVSPGNISKRLGISLEEAVEAVNFLIAHEMLKSDESGKIVRTEKRFSTLDNISSDQLKKIQANNLRMGVESLYRDDVGKRDFTTMTIAVDPKNIDEAKELIRKFERDLAVLLEYGEKKEVYNLTIGLYPLTRSL
ncbi:MAG: TIGR02147 family protein [Bacteriovorax sp.]